MVVPSKNWNIDSKFLLSWHPVADIFRMGTAKGLAVSEVLIQKEILNIDLKTLDFFV